MKAVPAKITFLLLVLLIAGCSPVKRVKDNQHLLTKNNILVNDEHISTRQIYNQLYQEPNVKLLRIPLRLHIYNLADPTPDSSFTRWLDKKEKRRARLKNIYSDKQVRRMRRAYISFNEFLEETGQEPTIVSELKTKKSANRLKAWYWNNGWFNVETDYKIIKNDNKRAEVEYYVTPHQAYLVDSITKRIKSPVADSLYQLRENEATVKEGKQFKTEDFEEERERITTQFRNNGLFHFEKEYITFDADTLDTKHKANVDIVIANREVTRLDSTYSVPYKVHYISKVNIFPDYNYDNRNKPITDSTSFKGYDIYSFEKLKYRPKAISDAVFIKQGEVYRDLDRSRTFKRMNELGQFKYPNIQYIPDPEDTTGTKLISNVFLTPKPKFGVTYNFDVSRSNIQDFGIGFGGSLLIRNVFKGAENLEISGRGSIGSSKDAAESEDRFFNISEIGGDLSLTFPKIAFPFINTEKIIPKSMSPFTTVSLGMSSQQNIGLDKQNVTGKFAYRWYPDEELTHKLNLLDLQYVRNLNTGNYFNVYRNSFSSLNEIAQNNISQLNPEYFNEIPEGETGVPDLIIPQGVNGFINDINNSNLILPTDERREARNIIERKERLTEDNLILATSFNYIKNTRDNIYDNEFTQFRFKLEASGNTLALASSILKVKENKVGKYNLFGVQFSQYLKGEVDFIKHWDLGNKNIIAVRALGGLAVPYGNSNSIPFARSFFAGGANDNRGWQAYDLGPGSTGGVNEFNEANMKITFNFEYRFNLFGALNSALFIDVGNIWNALDNVKDEAARFSSLKDLEELSVSSGIGLRYDLDFFVIRFDVGLKTYNPALEQKKWLRDYNFSNAVYNVGINYPF
ncbi:BamA/TamA family outer membrane protein [Mesonia sp. MT50]|uniref:BamA/TamA family outer membrane protein n=1 Tax=Mesonia profundi TaxID=3070998 RepID=A0ABU1A2W4_9FLAO|nr:BamA/TamA family outer membrane protein [Mesonia profundi]MDQ7917586.1 BamA/TamA family outer membrane protein [Mesonia profundi]